MMRAVKDPQNGNSWQHRNTHRAHKAKGKKK